MRSVVFLLDLLHLQHFETYKRRSAREICQEASIALSEQLGYFLECSETWFGYNRSD